MSELAQSIGKAPGVIQKGLNSLERSGYVESNRQGGRRLLRYNRAHPLAADICHIVTRSASPLSADIYLHYRIAEQGAQSVIAEPPGIYETSALKILIIAGPNGAGKTTFAKEYLQHEAGCPHFINADYIAHGLSPFSPEAAALKAGKLMLRELDDHVRHRGSLALETTLSGRRYARLIPAWQQLGYRVKLIFLHLPSVDMAIARVRSRVRQGGHFLPKDVILRRYSAGHRNFSKLYKPLVDAWALYDNSGTTPALLDEEER